MRSGKNSGKSSGAVSGEDSGADSGGERRALPIEEFVAALRVHHSALSPRIVIMRAGADGGVSTGARLGVVPLDPVEDLEDRVAAAHPGNHVLRLQARTRAGKWFAVGELELANAAAWGPAAAAPVPSATETLLAELLKRLDKSSTPDPMKMVGDVVGLVKGLVPGAAPLTTTDQLTAVREHMTMLREMATEVVGERVSEGERSVKSIFAEAMAKPLGELVVAGAALFAAKAAETHEVMQARAAARQRAEEAAQRDDEAKRAEQAKEAKRGDEATKPEGT
jgi:hypothetical protein